MVLPIFEGKEPDEMQREIQGLADASKLPLKFAQAIQALYELQTLMVPIVNFTKAKEHGLEDFTNGTFENSIPKAWEVLKHIPPGRVSRFKNSGLSLQT